MTATTKAFTFARGVEVDESWEELARRDLAAWQRPPTEDDIGEWIKAMKALLSKVEVGKQYVCLDGYIIPTDALGVRFRGWHSEHDLDFVPQIAALDDYFVMENILSSVEYWRARAIPSAGCGSARYSAIAKGSIIARVQMPRTRRSDDDCESCRRGLSGRNPQLARDGGRRRGVRSAIMPGYPPTLRVHGRLRQLDSAAFAPEAARGLLAPLCPAYAMGRFRADRNVDFSLELALGGRAARFRVNFFLSDDQMGACFRVIPSAIPDLQWAGFPEDLAQRLAHFRNGLVLICGVVGSGKSTTLAMLINLLNQEGGYRIVTVEEPVEYLLPKTSVSVVTQREVGRDVHTFADGLKYALRQDPDVILAGEIRDRDTARWRQRAAETGHLVLSTLHTRDAKGAISRYADLFPQAVQQEVRSQLAMSLRGRQPASAAQRARGRETGLGTGDHVQQSGNRGGDSLQQAGLDRHGHPDQPRRRHAHARRIDQALAEGRQHFQKDGRAVRQPRKRAFIANANTNSTLP